MSRANIDFVESGYRFSREKEKLFLDFFCFCQKEKKSHDKPVGLQGIDMLLIHTN